MLRMEMMAAGLMVVAAGPAQAHDRIRPPEPIGDPLSWFGPDAYPPAAMRAGAEGIVAVRLAIDPQGRVTGCDITRSSGSATLDNSTCRLMTVRGRFSPARQGEMAVAGVYDAPPITWRLPH